MIRKQPVATKPHNSLGTAQANLELAAKELRSAQKAYMAAAARLASAEESQTSSLIALTNEVNTLKNSCKVKSLYE